MPRCHVQRSTTHLSLDRRPRRGWKVRRPLEGPKQSVAGHLRLLVVGPGPSDDLVVDSPSVPSTLSKHTVRERSRCRRASRTGPSCRMRCSTIRTGVIAERARPARGRSERQRAAVPDPARRRSSTAGRRRPRNECWRRTSLSRTEHYAPLASFRMARRGWSLPGSPPGCDYSARRALQRVPRSQPACRLSPDSSPTRSLVCHPAAGVFSWPGIGREATTSDGRTIARRREIPWWARRVRWSTTT
jgi:hypothetical protein